MTEGVNRALVGSVLESEEKSLNELFKLYKDAAYAEGHELLVHDITNIRGQFVVHAELRLMAEVDQAKYMKLYEGLSGMGICLD